MRLIYFSPVPAKTYAQRPHFTAQAWLELGAESRLVGRSIPLPFAAWSDFRLIRGSNHLNTPLDSRVEVLHVPALPIEPLPGGTWINSRLFWRSAWKIMLDFAHDPQSTIIGIGRPCALALSALERLPHRASFYDAMDNFPQFHRGLSRQAIQILRRENRLHSRPGAGIVQLSCRQIYKSRVERQKSLERLSDVNPAALAAG